MDIYPQCTPAAQQAVIQQISRIDQYKSVWNHTVAREQRLLQDHQNEVTVLRTGSAMRLDGTPITHEEVAHRFIRLDEGESAVQPGGGPEGYAVALKSITQQRQRFEFSAESVLHLYLTLHGASHHGATPAGRYKTMPNKVVARYPDGSRRVIFNTTEPGLVEEAMERLLTWTRDRINQSDVHPLLLAGTFMYEFLAIHPFQQYNNSMVLLLTTALLVHFDYQFLRFVSLEEEIERRKPDFYAALVSMQQQRHAGNRTLDDWILFFLSCVEATTTRLEQTQRFLEDKGPYLNERQQKVMECIANHEPVKISDINAVLPEFSIHTLKKDVQYLCNEGVIRKTGKRKGTIYIMNEVVTRKM